MSKIILDTEYVEKYKDSAWMEVYTGRKFWPGRPRIEDFTIFDIAHSLGQKCRYNGHAATFYSVAEHATTLALYARHIGLSVRDQFHLLMHDAAEAYLPDVPRPIKHFFPELVLMEKVMDSLIRDWAGLDHDVPECVKQFDSRVIVDERRQMLLPSGNTWQVDTLEPLRVQLTGYGPQEGQARFLQAYQVIAAEFHGKTQLSAYLAGEFQGTKLLTDDVEEILVQASSDVRGFKPPDIRMIDYRGNCAMTIDPKTQNPLFLHGPFELVNPD